MMNDEEMRKKVEKFDEAAVHYLFTIFWSMITAIIITVLWRHL